MVTSLGSQPPARCQYVSRWCSNWIDNPTISDTSLLFCNKILSVFFLIISCVVKIHEWKFNKAHIESCDVSVRDILCHTSVNGSSDIVAGCNILCDTSLDGREVSIYGTTTSLPIFLHSSEILRSVEW